MNKHRKFKAAVGLGAGLLLLGTALAAWGITITLDDNNGHRVTCTAGGGATIDGNGDINANVTAGTGCDLSGGGGDPPPPGSYTLSVFKDGDGTGTVTGTGFDCGTDCTQTYPENTAINVTLTAAAAAGSTFTSWIGDCSSVTGNTCTVATTITSNLSVTATFTADAPPPGSCGATPPDVTVVDTGNLDAAWPTVEFSPAPATVMAFRVNVPSGFSGNNDFRATRLPPATKGKAIVVSNCPGSVQPVAATACTLQNVTDSALVRLSANSSANQFLFCKLTPGQTYYINAFSKNLLSDSGFNCSSTSTCRFQAFRGQPY